MGWGSAHVHPKNLITVNLYTLIYMYITVYLHNTFREDLSLVNKRGDGLLIAAIDWMSPQHHICEHPPKLAINSTSLNSQHSSSEEVHARLKSLVAC